MNRNTLIGLLILCGVAAASAAGLLVGPRTSGAPVPLCRDCNLIVLTLDAVRADHLHCYGYERGTAPNICRAAKQNLIFENAISQSCWTKASMGTLFTSVYPHNHGAVSWQDALPLELDTLAEVLKRNGYYNIAYQANPHIKAEYNFDQGFDEYYFRMMMLGERMVDQALANLKEAGHQKFFLYLHFMDTHLPYDPPRRYYEQYDRGYEGPLDKLAFGDLKGIRSGQLKPSQADKDHIVDLYDAEIRYVDDQLRKLFDWLKEAGLWERTIILIHSDHGEEFWDHGGFEHGHTMYNELLHVPLILIHPQLAGRAIRFKPLVRLIDVFPTLMSLLGLEAPKVALGRDLSRFLLQKEPQLDLEAYSEAVLYGLQKKAFQNARSKLIRNEDDPESFELYDLKADPREKANLAQAADRSDQVKKLANRIHKMRAFGPPAESFAGRKGRVSEETKKELKALGYM